MVVCRTCLKELSNNQFYSTDQILEENCEKNNDSTAMKLRKMIEKCVPEMDLDICDSPVICEGCCELLKSAYKFRNICVQTEEKVYQYIEKNNLRLGESIDLNNLANKHSSDDDIILIEETEVKKDDVSIEFEDMPLLLPEIDVRTEHRERQLIIKLNRISHSVLKNVESEHNRIYKNIAVSQETENTSVDESKYEKKPYNCEDCQYKASTWGYLKNHLLLKQCAKRHKCDECSYSTFRITHYKRHKMTHTGQKPFECEVCQKGYIDKWRLRGHMLEHQSVKDLPFKCQEEGCEYASSKQFELKIHMVRHIKGYPYFCKVCKTLSFTSKTELREHELNCAQRKEREAESVQPS